MTEHPVKILLVEDDIDMADLTIEAFQEKGPRFQITQAETGPTALEKLEQTDFDVVILDYTLPGMNGIEVLQRMKAEGLNVPVIIVSGQRNETIMETAMKEGAEAYIFKTVNYQETLPSSLEKVIEKSGIRKPR